MEELYIEGGHRLEGTVRIHGAKNSVLPLLAAMTLIDEPVTLENCPQLSDVRATLSILHALGCRAGQEGGIICGGGHPTNAHIADELMRQMRSSIIFLGPLLAVCGRAEVSLPGGCELGPRPIDWHLQAMCRMGAEIEESGGRVAARAPQGLTGCEISLIFPSVGATENILLAAVTAKGCTTIVNAAREPEIADLCRFLTACGARIEGIGGSTLVITGVPRLHGCRYAVMPDRMEAVTYALAAAVTGGTLCLDGADPACLRAALTVLGEMGCVLYEEPQRLTVCAPRRLVRARQIRSMPYPGFPTDAMAPFTAAACVAEGTSLLVETVFENRFRHVDELRRMGAKIKVDGRVAVVEGGTLCGAAVRCTDLRGGAALVLAALAAEGTSTVGALQHMERGYPDWERQLAAVGAKLTLQEKENG